MIITSYKSNSAIKQKQSYQEEVFLPKPSEEVLGNVLEAMPMVSQLMVRRASDQHEEHAQRLANRMHHR